MLISCFLFFYHFTVSKPAVYEKEGNEEEIPIERERVPKEKEGTVKIENVSLDRIEEKIVVEKFGECCEVIYDSQVWKTIPIDRWVKRWVKVRNVVNKKAVIDFEVKAKDERGEWFPFNSFPQPQILYLEPGEEQNIWFFADFGLPERKEYVPEEFKVILQNRETGEEKEVYLKNEYAELETVENSMVRGYVLDTSGNKLEGVEVEIRSAYPAKNFECWRVTTDENGYFEFPLFAHIYRDTKAYHGYSLSFRKDGFYDVFKVVFPKVGEIIEMNVTMKKREEEITFKKLKCYETGYPTWYVKVEDNCVVFAHGHYPGEEEVEDEKHGIYFFDLDGNLLWKKHVKNQVWGIDVSKDCSLVFAWELKKERGTMFDRNGKKLWDTSDWERMDSREVRISHNKNYVAVGSIAGDIYLANASTGKILWKIFLKGQVRQIRFSKDDKVIYACSDGYLYKINVENGEILGKTYTEAWLYRNSLSVSEDEKYAFTISKIGRACLVDLEKMQTLWCFDTRGGGHGTAISKNASFLVAVSGGSYGRILFSSDGKAKWYVPRVGGHAMFLKDDLILIDEMILDTNGDLVYSLEEDFPGFGEVEFSWADENLERLVVMKNNGKICFFARRSP